MERDQEVPVSIGCRWCQIPCCQVWHDLAKRGDACQRQSVRPFGHTEPYKQPPHFTRVAGIDPTVPVFLRHTFHRSCVTHCTVCTAFFESVPYRTSSTEFRKMRPNYALSEPSTHCILGSRTSVTVAEHPLHPLSQLRQSEGLT